MNRVWIGPPPLTHQFFAIVWTSTGWSICVAGRQGIGTSYCTPISLRFPTRKKAIEWRHEHLADKPSSYWVAPEGKWLINEKGNLQPCFKTERAGIQNPPGIES